ncbi:MAG: molecular chaperone HtpG, partial [Opitutaceae bacterium]|nr:molecular chaperone HtpG [Opitutaceae bacterium]
MPTPTPQKFEFQAEIKQLLDIVIHSLYTEKEIFVQINLSTDDKAKTLTLQDYGIGMTRAELVENLGTIAHSGSKQFLKALGEGDKKNANLIGQFGVGFYSAFMVAKSVKVYSHSWKTGEAGHVWSSDGSGSYEIEEVEGLSRGSKIVIELKDDCADYANEGRIKAILERYSAFVSFPINLNGKHINTVQALWLRSKSEIKEEEYNEFYKFQSHAYDEPSLRLHFSADAPLAINALLFVPQENTEKMGMSRLEPAVSLYCRKVLIDAAPKDLLPEWLRFLKGVVDSEDLPLNISRETMQDKALIEKLNKVITKRFLKFLDEEATQRPDSFIKFYANFGIYLKEGAALDFTHKDQLVKLLRFESSLTDKSKHTSLTDYVSRMGADQKEIYYLTGANRTTVESGPYLEAFKARNLEVLFCYEPVDEYVMNNVREFDGKKLIAADHGDVKLTDLPQADGALSADDTKTLTTWMKASLGERVAEVKASDRLVDSPALAINADKFMTAHMRRMMKAMNKDGADMPQRVNLEINPRSTVMKRLFETHTAAPEKAKLVAEQILDNALISAGMLEDATPMVA